MTSIIQDMRYRLSLIKYAEKYGVTKKAQKPQIYPSAVFALYRLLCVSNLLYIGVHQMPSEISIDKSFELRHFLMMLPQQFIWAVIDTKVLIDAFALDISVVAVEIYYRMTKISYRHTIATECAGAIGVCRLKAFKIRLIQNKRLQLIPSTVQIYLHPTVEYVFWRKGIQQPRHCALLQPFVNSKAMYAAANATASQQRHEQRPLGVALTVAIGKHLGGRNTVIGIVAEKYLVTNIIIDCLDALKFAQ